MFIQVTELFEKIERMQECMNKLKECMEEDTLLEN